LFFEDLETGKKSTNSVDALSQINGISISPAYEEPSDALYITLELLAKASRNYMCSSYANPNFSFLDFPSGTHTYKVYMTLDGFAFQ
jgi:hypothetical protein